MNTFSNLTNTSDLMINVFVKHKIKRKYQKLKNSIKIVVKTVTMSSFINQNLLVNSKNILNNQKCVNHFSTSNP